VLFVVGGLFSVYEGVHKLQHPEAIEKPIVPFVVLIIAIGLESFSLRTAVHETRPHLHGDTWWQFIRRAKSPELPVVLLEDTAALIGLVIAFVGITLAAYTGEPRFDAAASLLIAVLLAATSYFLARETKGLLIGEPAHPHVQKLLLDIAQADSAVRHANGVVTAQLGPDHVLVALSAEFEDGLRSDDIEASVQRIEHAIAAQRPDVVGVFVKPQSQATWTERRATLASPDTLAP
jgi:divalent metal cation (Fe/Co/Zn/Cd) transporter